MGPPSLAAVPGLGCLGPKDAPSRPILLVDGVTAQVSQWARTRSQSVSMTPLVNPTSLQLYPPAMQPIKVCLLSRRLAELLDDLAARLQRGERLYVHCWGGRGRAGTVGACLLAKLYGIDADEALARIDRAFSTRQDGANRSPETAEQQQYVRDFIARM
jgi:protein-tyrosine phosphatase